MPEPRDVGGRERRDVLALEHNAAAGRAEEFRQQVEACRLAGAVRTDQRMDRSALDPQTHAIDGDETGKFLGQILGFEDGLITHFYLDRYASPRAPYSPRFCRCGKAL